MTLALAWLATLVVGGAGSRAVWAWLTRDRRAAARAGVVALVGLGAGVVALGDDLGAQKLVSWLVMPVGLLWLALWALSIVALARRERGLAAGIAACLAALTLIGNLGFSQWLIGTLEAQVPDVAIDETLPRFDAVFVPGGGSGWSQGHAQLYDFGDRALLAARVWHAGKAAHLVPTGSSIGSLSDHNDLAEATAQLWMGIGVPAAVIVKLPEPKNTSQEVAAFRALVDARGWTKLAVVGSAWHLPRILALAERAGLTLVPLKADRRGGTSALHPALMVPQATAIRTTQLAAWEYLGRWVGR